MFRPARPSHCASPCVACLLIAAAAYKWGLPWAAAKGAQQLPPAVGKTLSAQTLKVLDGGILQPSKLAVQRRQALSAEFHALRLPQGGTAVSALLFRSSPQLGANAFTLPDGEIIVLDDLIASIGDDREILAVLAHELGHAHGRHGLQLLLYNGMSPGLLADALKKLADGHRGFSHGGYLSTHPATDERMRRLRALAVAFAAQ